MLGVLMLDTGFPRPPGDVGHVDSWRMPVRFQIVPGATPQRVVREAESALLQPFEPFLYAARQLVDAGARAITTSCGFLVLRQQALQAALPVPVWTSSLLLLPQLQQAGVLTVDDTRLGAAHLQAAGLSAAAAQATPIVGLAAGCHLQTVLLQDLPTLNSAQAEADTLAAARLLLQRHPQVQQLVLECTNLPPYAAALERACGRPVQHLMSLVHERYAALG
jgi:hypothetical protein